MPVASIGHPDGPDCNWKGEGAGCAIGINMTLMWLRLGGRGIDTAADYGGHQAQVGAAIKQALAEKIIADRSEVFVTTKITPFVCTKSAAVAAILQEATARAAPTARMLFY